MAFQIEFKPRSVKDLEKLSADLAGKVIEKIDALQAGLKGDIKRLTNFSPEYRLRVGDYRVLLRWKTPALSCIG